MMIRHLKNGVAAVATTLIFVSIAAAQDPETESRATINFFGVSGLSAEQEYAYLVSSQNENLEYPDLEYWGVRDATWYSDGKIQEDSEDSMGFAFTAESKFDNDRLIAVVRNYAVDLDTRPGRRAVFERLWQRLQEIYGYPTHPFNPPADHVGEDAYVKGVNSGYQVEWHGGQTVISLTLSDDELAVTFRPAENSQALSLTEAKSEALDVILSADEIR